MKNKALLTLLALFATSCANANFDEMSCVDTHGSEWQDRMKKECMCWALEKIVPALKWFHFCKGGIVDSKDIVCHAKEKQKK